MPRKKSDPKTTDMFEITEQLRTAPCVPAIREALKLWRSENYKGVTETTNELLNFWFKTDHRLANGQRFKFHAAQQEAIETKVAD